MNGRIIVHRDGQDYGPYTRAEIDQLLISGEVAPTDQARLETAAEWYTVRDLRQPTTFDRDQKAREDVRAAYQRRQAMEQEAQRPSRIIHGLVECSAYRVHRTLCTVIMVLIAVGGLIIALVVGLDKGDLVTAWSVAIATFVTEVIFYSTTILLCDIADLLIELVHQGRERK